MSFKDEWNDNENEKIVIGEWKGEVKVWDVVEKSWKKKKEKNKKLKGRWN